VKRWAPFLAGLLLGTGILFALGAFDRMLPSTQNAPEHKPVMVTYELSANGDAGTNVTFTCRASNRALNTCTTSIPAGGDGSWSEYITVELGTTLLVQARSDSVIAPRCGISDRGQRVYYARDEGADLASCQFIAS